MSATAIVALVLVTLAIAFFFFMSISYRRICRLDELAQNQEES